jgi:hypothetical protein
MKGNRVARRRRASSFPEITGVRLVPIGGDATLVNLSATGVLVECATRVAPGMPVTVMLEGTFTPSSVAAKVVRCEVAAIGADGSLRFHLGLAFGTRLAAADDDEPEVKVPGPVLSVPSGPSVPSLPSLPPMAAVQMKPAVLRNRW